MNYALVISRTKRKSCMDNGHKIYGGKLIKFDLKTDVLPIMSNLNSFIGKSLVDRTWKSTEK